MSAPNVARRPITRVVNITNADTEYSADFSDLDDQVKQIEFQCRTSADIRYAFEQGKVETPTDPYMTLKQDNTYGKGNLLWNKPIIYFAADSGSLVVEVTVWI